MHPPLATHGPFSSRWLGSTWSDPVPPDEITRRPGQKGSVPEALGLYRIWFIKELPDRPDLYRMAYIGQGHLPSRVAGTWSRIRQVDPNDAEAYDMRLASLAHKLGSTYDRCYLSWTTDRLSPHDLNVKKEREAAESYHMWAYRLRECVSALANHGRSAVHHKAFGGGKSRAESSSDRSSDESNSSTPENEDWEKPTYHISHVVTKRSHPPLCLVGFSANSQWMGLNWTRLGYRGEFNKSRGKIIKQNTWIKGDQPGLYKIISENARNLLQVGKSEDVVGKIRNILNRFPDKAVGSVCRVPVGMFRYHYQELVDDLIGGYYAQYGRAPRYQNISV